MKYGEESQGKRWYYKAASGLQLCNFFLKPVSFVNGKIRY